MTQEYLRIHQLWVASVIKVPLVLLDKKRMTMIKIQMQAGSFNKVLN
jgi:hypothetical protein